MVNINIKSSSNILGYRLKLGKHLGRQIPVQKAKYNDGGRGIECFQQISQVGRAHFGEDLFEALPILRSDAFGYFRLSVHGERIISPFIP